MDDYDFIIIGAGASGINAAHKVQTEFPGVRYIVLEARDTIGGTWNFFKYPGLRSDSSLTSFGFKWRPWSGEKEIADGPSIQKYLEESVAYAGIDKHIQLKHKVIGAHWSSADSKWTLEIDVNGGEDEKTVRSTFVLACSGYYDYKTPLQAEIPGISNFKGTVVHPQFWPDDFDYSGKRIVIIGSGATTVTILPVLAKTAAKVTMLQRSPGYVLPIASAPSHIYAVRKFLPKKLADTINFWKGLIFETIVRSFCVTFPNFARRMLIKVMAKELEGSGIPVDPHFTPRYYPWSQRLCICPDGDFYEALRGANCDVVTDHIETVTDSGIKTQSGKTIDTDIIITATGLRILILGGMDFTVDGQRFDVAKKFAWRNFMLEDVPNIAMVIGYTDMAWTLGSDACLRLFMRVIHHMKKIGAVAVRPVVQNREALKAEPIIGMKSTYFVVAQDRMPRKADVDPWNERSGYLSEILMATFGRIGTITKGLAFTMAHGNEMGPRRVNGHANGHVKAD
ncbi:FAD-containing monooxygenase EthA [Cytospora mali]|uniref:FAD-containing monooxygenase EthA n=1 Tax=Cytospora mali TaxID=578113 RepID=A0A194VUZ8_CYTMA|nr:FAD-containing monooxygenase EthA [Valsa mali]